MSVEMKTKKILEVFDIVVKNSGDIAGISDR